VGLKLNETRQLLVYTDDVNLLGDNIHVDTIKNNTEALIDASTGVDLEVNTENRPVVAAGPKVSPHKLKKNTEKTKYVHTYMLLSR
jgi:uncharacterized membrane protein (UPF0182 family)